MTLIPVILLAVISSVSMNTPAASADDGAKPRTELSGTFQQVPDAHEGSRFTFEFHLSEEVALSFRTVRDTVITADGGKVVKAKRFEKGSNLRWRITVEPDSNADVLLGMRTTASCDDADAVCTEDGRELAQGPEPTLVAGPPNDYDADDDGLIEVASLQQLFVMRYDEDGNGEPNLQWKHPDYEDAFPNPAARMGCPETGCRGYELSADLDFDTDGDGAVDEGDLYWNAGKGWDPVLDYYGVFDGNGHSISNLYVNGRVSGALFDHLSNSSEVKNLALDAVNITASELGGALALYAHGQVSNVSATGKIVVDGPANVQYGGGLVTHLRGTMKESSADVDVTVTKTGNGDAGNAYTAVYAGGLVAYVKSSGDNNWGSVSDSYATGDVYVSGYDIYGMYGGGIAGCLVGEVTDSYATGNITLVGDVTLQKGGGLAGSSNANIIRSYSTGNVTVKGNSQDQRGGGLTGVLGSGPTFVHGSGIITDSYATGDVTLTVPGDKGLRQKVGGLVGVTNTTITNSYSVGRVTVAGDVPYQWIGGVIGEVSISSSAVVSGNYWDTKTSGWTTSAGGAGKTTSELQTPTSATGIYADWDDDVWNFGTSAEYPTLQ